INATYTFEFTGIYPIELNVFDENGNVGTDIIFVTVIDNTWPIANAGLDQNIGENTLVYFDGSASFDNDGIESYLWTFTDGEPKSLTGINSSYYFDTPGIYEVTLTVSDLEENSANDTVIIVVRDITAPKIEFTEFSEITEGVPSIFNASKSYDPSGIDSFYWIFGDDTTENSSFPSVIHTYVESGTYALELFVTDKAGNVNSDIISVNVNPDPNTNFSSGQSDEKDEDITLVNVDQLNSDPDIPDTTNANINSEDETQTELEENESKTNPETDNPVGFSLGDFLTIVIILLLTSYVLYVKWQVRIEKINEHQNNL
ncbi:PKD domain-containing protein, partial [Candidatus Bathyarchaeota archaeon]